MIVGTEWLVEAAQCDAEKLRDLETLKSVFARIIVDLELKVVGEPLWHKFPAPGAGVTGLALLTESHLACHTYPEHGFATFNLYCCRERTEWNWDKHLAELINAKQIKIQRIERRVNSTAAVPAAVPSASRARLGEAEDNPFETQYGTVKIRGRGYLPHWEKEGGTYFVTFNLFDALPEKVVKQLAAEREITRQALEEIERKLSPTEEREVAKLFHEKLDNYLDSNYGDCFLKNKEVARIVLDALNYFDNKRYRLFAWCVMPNHVHVVFTLITKVGLDEVLHSWKSYTAKEANKILGREGTFWRREYYDHLIRNKEEFYHYVQYTVDNPVKAGLKNWIWVGALDNLVGGEQNQSASAGRTRHSRQDGGGTIGGTTK